MRRLCLMLAVTAAAFAAAAPAASAQVAFAPCPDAGFQAFECATLPQPLDRTGAVPGQVPLFMRRLRAQPGAQTRTALVALAGGPGQAATPAAQSFATSLAPGVRDRDLLVPDQRGTGQSGPLQCAALQSGRQTLSAISRCGQQLGAARGLYRTVDSVQDLEAIRVAAGYEQLAFYGVSYGTKVALEYAARYPDRVERLILDSVVPITGPDPLQRSSFRSVPPVLRELCAGTRCRGVTPNARNDIRTLVRRDRAIRGTVVSSRGRRQRVSMTAQDIYEILSAGDLNPAWRALLPGAVRAAVRGDGSPLVRLGVSSLGSTSAGALQREDAGVNTAVFLATACEDITFPWNRGASPEGRANQATAALLREPAATFSPFDRKTAAGSGVIGQCLAWPNATPGPAPVPTTLPAVPTLILNGTADLRTPAVDAAAIAGTIGGAQLVTVPNVGHSVLGSDPSGCAQAAIAGFFNGAGATPCPPAEPAVAPVSRPVRSLGELSPTRLSGRVGRTVTAVLRTQEDVLTHALGVRLAGGSGRFGGLRGGTVTQTDAGVTLRGVVVVPGVTVSGTFPSQGDARLTVRGAAAARGSLTIARDGRITGRLGGRRVLLVPRAQAAAVRPGAAPAPFPDLVRLAGS